jgi:hypothetical protein
MKRTAHQKALRVGSAIALLVAGVAVVDCGGIAPRVRQPGRVEPQPVESGYHRGLYVTDATALVRDQRKQDAFLALVRAHRIDHLVLYGLGPVLQGEEAAGLSHLIRRVREEAAVRSVAAPVTGEERLRMLLAYGQAHPEGAFDAVVTELEYWNRCQERSGALEGAQTERADCFPAFLSLLKQMRVAAETEHARGRSLRVGAYLGYPNAAEVREIAAQVDYVLLNYHVRTPEAAWGHVRTDTGPLRDRFRAFLDAGVQVWPIFYARGEVDMSPWLNEHGLRAAEDVFLTQMEAELGAASRHSLGGFQYFADDVLPPTGK